MTKKISILITLLLFLSCNKDTDEFTTIKNISIHFTQTVNGSPLVLNNTTYTNQFNQSFNIQTLKYLISNITLHAEDNINTNLDEVHFIDVSSEGTLLLELVDIVNHNYNSISFTMGLDSTMNFTDLYLNENFFPSFTWPEMMGGGYHYMQLEGKFNDSSFYNTHTGGANGMDYSFRKSFPIALDSSHDLQEIHINMEITNWYVNPQTLMLTSNGIMGNSDIQVILRDNGFEDVFSLSQQNID